MGTAATEEFPPIEIGAVVGIFMSSLTPKMSHIILPQMSSTNQYQPLIPDIPVLVVLPSHPPETEIVFQVLTQSLQLPLTSLEHPDIHWLNAEESLKIEVVRELQIQVGYKPYSADVSCYVLSHLETASQPAQQALLKILEEPPQHVRLVLTASSTFGLLPTILSRCQLLQIKAETSSQTQEIASWYQQVTSLPLGKLVEVADEIGDKELADTQAQTLIHFLHQELASHLSSPERTRILKQLQVTREYLEWLSQNVNLKLATSEWLFQLRQA